MAHPQEKPQQKIVKLGKTTSKMIKI